MVKNYTLLFLTALLFFSSGITAQEIQIFTVEDFDLIGKVKSCLVSTSYGKEEYEFNSKGLLIKSVTRYNESDYDVTYYKYANGKLLEKRLENYRDDVFDNSTSIANIYAIDSLLDLKITEKIVSYNKEFIDQYEYFYNNDTLNKIIRSNNNGIDETLISYTDIEGEQTKTFELNGFIQKSIRSSISQVNDSVFIRTLLTKKFIEGEPNTAAEEVYNSSGKIISRTKFEYDLKAKQFAKQTVSLYGYDEAGMLKQIEDYQKEELQDKKEYVYQFDVHNNWIKEIITPDNLYKTREISYFEEDELEVKQ